MSHSAVIEHLRNYGIKRETEINKKNQLKGQIPFGFNVRNGHLIKNIREQNIIREIKQMHITGFSLREIANELNKRRIPTKNNGIWQANTIRKILLRERTSAKN